MRPSSNTPSDRYATVAEAAEILGITPDAVRSRLRRGTLRKDRGPDGEMLVVLDSYQSGDKSTIYLTTVALIAARQNQIASPETEVEAWREEARRKDDLLTAALERIPALKASSAPRYGHQTTTEGSGNGTQR